MQRAREEGAEGLVWEMKKGRTAAREGRSRSIADGTGLGDESDLYGGAIDATSRGKRGVALSSRRETTFRGTEAADSTVQDELTWEPTPTTERNPKRRKLWDENDRDYQRSGKAAAEDDESQRERWLFVRSILLCYGAELRIV